MKGELKAAQQRIAELEQQVRHRGRLEGQVLCWVVCIKPRAPVCL